MHFGPESTTDEVLEGVDLGGRRVIVTGASGGLGAETARALVSRGAFVTIAARDIEKAEGVASAIRDQASGQGRIEVGPPLELMQPDSIRTFAKQWLAENDRLDVLINNAGVMFTPLRRNAQGWEMQFATNHMGHFLLTCLLAPALREGAPARVVNLSSGGHRFGEMDFEDPNFERRPYDKFLAYGQSKTANVLFSVELTRRLAASGVHANAVHPGVIMTELARYMEPDDMKTLADRATGGGLRFKPVEAGAATSVWAATSPELEGRGGLYLQDCQVAAVVEDANEDVGCAGYAVDPDAAQRLWALSEELLGERFPL